MCIEDYINGNEKVFILVKTDKNSFINGKVVGYDIINKTKVTEGNYKDGKREGKFILYDKEKIASEALYKDDKRDGLSVFYYENGRKYEETFYKNGIINGKRIYYYEDGKLKEVAFYLNGKREGQTIFITKMD
ncbi:MAG: hypothetical protein Ta2D_09650 [Rickettsiales bacterium]|nr:MAG: hypothetical protein Ta2D_09650 [Rickettsiales bacterium]